MGGVVVVGDDNVVGGGRGVEIQSGDESQSDQGADDLSRDEPGTEVGSMPAKVSENIRPIVTAGLANEVELVNQ